MDNQHLYNEPAGPSQPCDNTPMPGPESATAADNWNPRFTPGSIIVHYNGSFTAFLPTDILPPKHHDICWRAENLAFASFVGLVREKLGISLDTKQVLADVGQAAHMPINTGKDWYIAMQMCHDKDLKQCVFYVLGEDVVGKPEPAVEEGTVVHQVPRFGWGRLVAAVGAVGAAGVAVQMGYLPGTFLG